MSNLASYSSHLNTACLLFLRHLQVLCMGLSPDRMAQEQLTSGAVALAGTHHSQRETVFGAAKYASISTAEFKHSSSQPKNYGAPYRESGICEKERWKGRIGRNRFWLGSEEAKDPPHPRSAASGWETVTVTGWGPKVCFAPLSTTGWELSHSQIQS